MQDRRIGFVFQSYALFQHMSCADNISFGPRMKQLDINVDERCGCLIYCIVIHPQHCPSRFWAQRLPRRPACVLSQCALFSPHPIACTQVTRLAAELPVQMPTMP